MQTRVWCQCGKRIVLGVHLVERFWPDEKRELVFHRECYGRFMAELEAKRNRAFAEEIKEYQEYVAIETVSKSPYQKGVA